MVSQQKDVCYVKDIFKSYLVPTGKINCEPSVNNCLNLQQRTVIRKSQGPRTWHQRVSRRVPKLIKLRLQKIPIWCCWKKRTWLLLLWDFKILLLSYIYSPQILDLDLRAKLALVKAILRWRTIYSTTSGLNLAVVKENLHVSSVNTVVAGPFETRNKHYILPIQAKESKHETVNASFMARKVTCNQNLNIWR